MNFSLVYVPCSGFPEAEAIAKTLLDERLIACANILGAGQSLYTWQGKFEQSIEVYMLLKTKSELIAELRERVLALHSYDTPCVLEVKAESVNEAYASWLAQMSR